MIKMKIPQGYKQTELGIIPEDWEIKKIFQLGEVVTGSTPSRNVAEYWNGNFHWVSAIDFSSKYITKTNETLTDLGKRQCRVLSEGAVLVTCIASIGLNAIANTECATNQQINAVICNNNVYNEYLYYQICNQKHTLLLLAGQTAVPIISKSEFQEFAIAIPSNIEEQQRIAEALSDVDALIAALDKKIAKKRLIKQGAMQQLLTGKKRLQGFCGDIQKVALLELGRFVSGNRFPLRYQGNSVGDYPFYKVSDFNTKSNENYLNISNNYVTKDTANNLKCNIIPKNSIVFAKIGAAIFLERKKICLADCCIDNNMMSFIPNKNFDTLFIYYFLRTISFGELVETTALPSLGVKTLGEIIVNIPPTIEEQKAIAKSLSDMDKEIVDLEARRDKYKLIKNGMMQKLLTGQIRLTKPQAKVIPLATQIPATREIPIDAHIIAGHIVYRSYQSRGWGRTKLQKSLHLIGYSLQLNLGNEFIRNTAGPDDQLFMNYIDQKFRQYRHVNIVKEKLPDGRTHYTYIPTAQIQEVEMAYEQYPQDVREQIDALLDKLNTMDLSGAEILSTLYAVWNNRIIKGEQITDDLLIADFYAWSAHKADFEEIRVRKVLDYMRKQNIIPVGWGKYIDKR